MTSQISEFDINSEDGDPAAPSRLIIVLNGNLPSCPITFLDSEGKAFFSMGNDELSDFLAALEQLSL